MIRPLQGDYIDVHTHNGKTSSGVFFIETIMAHEERTPADLQEKACTFGIHPWYLKESNYNLLVNRVEAATAYPNLIALGESGFDKLRGPSRELQIRAFEAQVAISEEIGKPLVIHCVRAWDELLASYKKFHPEMPWLIHGFRGSSGLATQLVSKGMFLSFWFDFIIRAEATKLLQSLPKDRIFFETDGSDISIRTIYEKAAKDLDLAEEDLKSIILSNFNNFFQCS